MKVERSDQSIAYSLLIGSFFYKKSEWGIISNPRFTTQFDNRHFVGGWDESEATPGVIMIEL